MAAGPIIVPPGQGSRVGNVEFLARTTVPVRMLNVHAPAGFDRRIGLKE